MNESNAKKSPVSALKLCVVALAIVINLIGGQIALMLKLPIFLDCIGTLFVGAVLGPFYGMLPNLLSGLIMGMSVDVFSLYYAPVGIITGFMAGLVFKGKKVHPMMFFLMAFIITVPGTIISSLITAFLFGGITSSGNTVLVQLLAKTPLGLTGACFVVQIITDYIDRVIALFVAVRLISAIPADLMTKIKGR